MVSCSVRWKRIAFSMAMAQGSTRVSRSSRSAWVNLPPCLLITCTTPMVRPREMRGAQRTDLVWNCVEASNRRAKRGSFEVSFTMVGSPVCATQPAIPSPTLTRNTATSLPFSPRASSKVSSCFSSSSIRMDQASDGISSWTLAMISSMILRGSRMEFAVFTMSVRIDSRRVVVRRRPWVSPARRAWPSRARAASKWASTSRAGGSPVRQEPRWKS